MENSTIDMDHPKTLGSGPEFVTFRLTLLCKQPIELSLVKIGLLGRQYCSA